MEIILDSSAFSAYTLGMKIDLEEYIQFCLKNLDVFDYIVNLDVIPPYPATSQQVEDSAQGGWRNYERMIEAAIPRERLMHVFHMGENFKWLRRMVEEVSYIGLSPENNSDTITKILWLDQCMRYVVDADGNPKVKFHGFGVSVIDLLFRYPWFSVDASSWIKVGVYGSVYIPKFKNKKPVYNEPGNIIFLSGRKGLEDSKHIDNFTVNEKKIFFDYIESKGYRIGISEFKYEDRMTYKLKENETWFEQKKIEGDMGVEVVIEEGLTNSYKLRTKFNFDYFSQVMQVLSENPVRFKSSGLKGLLL